MFTKYAAIAASAAAFALASPVAAATFNTTTVGNNKGTVTPTTITVDGFNIGTANVFQSALSDGLSFKAYAFTAASPTASPGYSALGWYDRGLGIINPGDNGGANYQHTVDNVGQYDFIAFQFNKAVRLTGMTLNGYPINGPADTDAWVSYTNSAQSLSAITQTQGAAIWTALQANSLDAAKGAMPNTANLSGNIWIIGAARIANPRLNIDLGDDGFKIGSISAVAAPVPEPATWATMMLGFGLAGSALRRRRSTVSFA